MNNTILTPYLHNEITIKGVKEYPDIYTRVWIKHTDIYSFREDDKQSMRLRHSLTKYKIGYTIKNHDQSWVVVKSNMFDLLRHLIDGNLDLIIDIIEFEEPFCRSLSYYHFLIISCRFGNLNAVNHLLNFVEASFCKCNWDVGGEKINCLTMIMERVDDNIEILDAILEKMMEHELDFSKNLNKLLEIGITCFNNKCFKHLFNKIVESTHINKQIFIEKSLDCLNWDIFEFLIRNGSDYNIIFEYKYFTENHLKKLEYNDIGLISLTKEQFDFLRKKID
jgi:hypothetical protein